MDNIPKNFIETDLHMSNFDHSIDKGLNEKLKSGPFYADYAAWNFHGDVWFQNEKFYCKIMRYKLHINTITADSLEDIMKIASDKHGVN